ncbi:MAG: hypothetical protein QOF24_3156 [Verrucomicrobiota bacterium]
MPRKTRVPKRRHSAHSAEFSLVGKQERKTDRLLETVRRLALKQQKNHPQAFLSLRKAAKRFGVPISAMATVYKKLTEERVLASVRGSHTMLSGHGALRHLKVRGLIGLPVSLSRFQTFLEYQRCLTRIRDELHERGFLTSTIFFQQPEGQPEIVLKQLRSEKVNEVIWLLPDGADGETVLRLRDLGIRFAGVNITPLAGMSCRYQVRRQQAIRAIARSWRADPKISGATIVRLAREAAVDEERLGKLQALVESENIECENCHSARRSHRRVLEIDMREENGRHNSACGRGGDARLARAGDGDGCFSRVPGRVDRWADVFTFY